MVQLPVVSEADTRDTFTVTPIDDYELIDFGGGRKLERWGSIIIECPDRLAVGLPAVDNWNADWIYVADVGVQGHWEPTSSGLPSEWTVSVNGQSVVCRLDPRGRVGLRGRDITCAQWVSQRIDGCYDLEEIRVLNLFGGRLIHLKKHIKYIITVTNLLKINDRR